MKNTYVLLIILILIDLTSFSQSWAPAGDKIKTQWSEKVDPTNPLPEYPRPGGIWYSPVTGIWQTVWIEPVNENYITSLISTPDIDGGTVSIKVETADNTDHDLIKVNVIGDGISVGEGMALPGQEALISIASPKLWSPGTPYLDDLEVSLLRSGKTIETVKSYFGMRKISTKISQVLFNLTKHRFSPVTKSIGCSNQESSCISVYSNSRAECVHIFSGCIHPNLEYLCYPISHRKAELVITIY